ncbi:MAG: M20/M25/M40 family metallo-hydrolase [Candidatus Eisenbacteria bacterium]
MKAREILRELVLCPSSEADDARPVLRLAEEIGRGLGGKATPIPNGDRPALLLSWGKPRLLFSGHLDTVPVSGTWKSTTGTEKSGRLYGRGTTDMKAGCAAMLAAAARLRDRGEFGILFTTDEETVMHGAEAAVARGVLANTELVIIGEPTGLRPCLGQKGLLQVAITTEGASGHASMPWAGTNAIGRMGRILAALKPLAGATPRQATTMTASPDVIEGGVAMNVIADHCRLQLDVRYSPKLSEKQASAKLDALLKRAKVPYRIEPVHRLKALASKPGPVARRLKKLANRPFGFCDFATEAACFAPTGAAFLVMGPGRPQDCHITDESIELRQVDEAVKLYEAALA